MRTMSYREFKRRVFNEALQECLTKFTLKCCGGENGMDTNLDSSRYTEIAANMSKDFYNNLLNLNERTITETKKCMSEAVTFIQDCIAVSEAIAEEKANDAQEEHLEISACRPFDHGKLEYLYLGGQCGSRDPNMRWILY